MNIGEEKRYIYEQMSDITQERRKLTDIYYELKKRLDGLNQLEERGFGELSTKGYVDLHNEKSKTVPINNMFREMNHIAKKIEKDHDKRDESVPEEDIIKEKHKEPKKRGSLDLDKVSALIAETLKESGRPMTIPDIHKKVSEKTDYNISLSNFRTNILRRALDKNKKITKAMRGHYQYTL